MDCMVLGSQGKCGFVCKTVCWVVLLIFILILINILQANSSDADKLPHSGLGQHYDVP